MNLKDNVSEITPEMHRVLSATKFTGKTMKKDTNFIPWYKFWKKAGCTGDGDRPSKQKTCCLVDLSKKVAKTEERILNEAEFDDSQGEGSKMIFASNIIVISSRLEVLLGLKLPGHPETLREARNVINGLLRIRETQNKKQYENALDNSYTQLLDPAFKHLEKKIFITRLKIEEHMIIVMDKSTQEENSSEPLLSRQCFGPKFCVVWPRNMPASGWWSLWESSSFVPWFSTFVFQNVSRTVSQCVRICWFKRNSSNLDRALKIGTLSCWTPGTVFYGLCL